MRRFRPFVLLAIALVTAIGASSYVYRWLQAQALEAKSVGPEAVAVQEKAIETTKVAVAAVEVPWGQSGSESTWGCCSPGAAPCWPRP